MLNIAAMIPARNEENHIEKTIINIRKIAELANIEIHIVISNDGSKDKTGEIARNLGCYVVEREDRG